MICAKLVPAIQDLEIAHVVRQCAAAVPGVTPSGVAQAVGPNPDDDVRFARESQ
jgi:hypothetical protein